MREIDSIITVRLLSEVMGTKIELWEVNDNTLTYTSHHCPNPIYDKSINIYEFAYKNCVEWARTLNKVLLIFGKIVYVVPCDFNEDKFDFYEYPAFIASDNMEAICEAATYILESEINPEKEK